VRGGSTKGTVIMHGLASMGRVRTGLGLVVVAAGLVACADGPDIGRVPAAPTATSPSVATGSDVASPSPTPSEAVSSPSATAGTDPGVADDDVAGILEDLGAEDGPEGTLVSIDAARLFGPDSAELTSAGEDRLDVLVEALVLLDDAPVTIHGHSDVPGAGDDARVFAHRRGAAIAVYVVNEGIDKDRLTVDGFGQSEDQRIEVFLPTVDLDELSST